MKTKKNSLRKDLKLIKFALILLYRLKKSYYVYSFFGSLVMASLPFIPLFFGARILDELFTGRRMDVIAVNVGLLIGLYLLFHILRGILESKLQVINNEVRLLFERELAKKTMTMDYELVEDTGIQELLQKIRDAFNMRGGMLGIAYRINNLFKFILEIIIASSIISMLFSKADIMRSGSLEKFISSGWPGVIILILIILVLIINVRQNSKRSILELSMMDYFMPKNRHFGYVMFKLCRDYENGKDFRIYNANRLLKKHAGSLIDEADEFLSNHYIKEHLKITPITAAANGFMTGSIFLFVVIRALAGVISIGSILKHIGSVQRLFNAISNFAIDFVLLRLECRFMEHTEKFLNLPPVKYHGTLPVEKRRDNKYDIEFKNVSFKYPGKDEYALKDVSFNISIGERLAVVGMNGAGKTTMVKLLCRLYDPTEGSIYLNGIDIKKYDIQEYRTLFSVVFQDFKLFAFQISQNIACSTEPEAESICDSLNGAGLADRIDMMENGADTYISKRFDEGGVDISGGESQKVAIARALYKDASIVVLDEPTAALDPIAEYDIYSRFDELVGNKTAIYISHRLSSCRFCHDIMVFHDGEIIQRGSHEDLIADEVGKYHELWTAQAQYYI